MPPCSPWLEAQRPVTILLQTSAGSVAAGLLIGMPELGLSLVVLAFGLATAFMSLCGRLIDAFRVLGFI